VIEGDYARIEVIAEKKPSGLKFKLREAAYQRTSGVPFSISVPDEREAIVEYRTVPQIFTRSRAVAKLTFIADRYSSSCTGFLLDDERMIFPLWRDQG
jgi:hypothetical protein